MAYAIAARYLEEDDGSGQGRIVTLDEFIEKIRSRRDIFKSDSDRKTIAIELVCLLLAVVCGSKLSSTIIEKIAPDMPLDIPSRSAPIDRPVRMVNAIDRPEQNVNTTKRVINRPKANQQRKQSNHPDRKGVGIARARASTSKIFQTFSSVMSGLRGAEDHTLNGFTSGIDNIILGKRGVPKSGSSQVGRRGQEFIGYADGIGSSGFDGTGSGIDDILGELTGPDEAEIKIKAPKMRQPIEIKQSGNAFGSSRNRSSIMQVVYQHVNFIRYLYNQRLRLNPALKGKIVVRFAIDEFGNVIACEIDESTIQDSVLENLIKSNVMKWKFDKIDKPGDITEIVYPFVFSA